MDIITYLETSFANNRSSKRTDVLNSVLLDKFLTENPQWSHLNYQFEVALPDAYGATFKVDCVGFDDDNNPIVVLLNKNANSNFAQNLKNYANTTVGEAARILLGECGKTLSQVYFITVHPNFSPFFKSGGAVGRIEDVNRAKKRTNIIPVIRALYPNKVTLVTVTFDINEIREFTHKDQFCEGVTVSNLETTYD